MYIILKILFFPFTLFNYIKLKEKMLLFCVACTHKNISDPTVWDVDVLHKSLLEFIGMIQKNPKYFFKSSAFRTGLFLHRLALLFRKKLDFPRDDVKLCLERYTELKNALDEVSKIQITEEMKKELGEDDCDIQVTPTLIYHVWKDMAKDYVFSFK